jgi:prepilin-type N-terminal cleavage/methylation domain-containing protein
MTKDKKKAFTLIELLMVVAIIGILAGILIPTVGAVRKQANIAASKSQLANYLTAMQMFKGEYGYFPLATGTGDSDEIDIASESKAFMQAISGRNPTTGATVIAGGNRRGIAFHSFSESELQYDASDKAVTHQIADRFNNINIFIVVDTNGDGFVAPAGPNSSEGRIKTNVTAYVVDSSSDDFESYKLWD